MIKNSTALIKPNKYISIAISLLFAGVFLYLCGRDVKMILDSQVALEPIKYVAAVIWGAATVAMVVRAFKTIFAK